MMDLEAKLAKKKIPIWAWNLTMDINDYMMKQSYVPLYESEVEHIAKLIAKKARSVDAANG